VQRQSVDEEEHLGQIEEKEEAEDPMDTANIAEADMPEDNPFKEDCFVGSGSILRDYLTNPDSHNR
jgi:hypothetical protein